MLVERRLTPRIKMTARRHVAYWVAMSRTRRMLASLTIVAAISVTTFGARQASHFGPDSSVSRNLVSASGGLSADEDSDAWPQVSSKHERMRPDEAEADERFVTSVETRLPIIESAYNSCRNELVMLAGTLRTRVRLQANPVASTGLNLQAWTDARGITAEAALRGDYSVDGKREDRDRIVRYHNRGNLVDKFEVNSVGLPFQSTFEARIHLQREGADPTRAVLNAGDDLFVYVTQTVKTDQHGITQTENQFRTECS